MFTLDLCNYNWLYLVARNKIQKIMYLIILLDVKSGPQNIRRLVEILRADVVQGIGIKLLEKVYYAMEEEDEQKREVCFF